TQLAFSQATQANAVFAILPNDAADRIRARFRFYDWDRAAGQVRWMTAYDTTEADVDAFVAAIREELARGGSWRGWSRDPTAGKTPPASRSFPPPSPRIAGAASRA